MSVERNELASNKEVAPEDEKPIEKLPIILAAHSRVSTCSGSKTSVRLSVSSGGSFQNPGLDQLEVDLNSDVPIDFVVQNFFLKLLGVPKRWREWDCSAHQTTCISNSNST